VFAPLILWLNEGSRGSEPLSLLSLVCTLAGGVVVLAGVPWFAIAVVRLLRWDSARKTPGGPSHFRMVGRRGASRP